MCVVTIRVVVHGWPEWTVTKLSQADISSQIADARPVSNREGETLAGLSSKEWVRRPHSIEHVSASTALCSRYLLTSPVLSPHASALVMTATLHDNNHIGTEECWKYQY